MLRKSQRVRFENRQGIELAGIIELPDKRPDAWALFSHCFTCTKDLKAIVRVSRELALRKIAVLRFDFTGLGDSKGVFAESNFETNQSDILAAVDFLANHHQAPKLLIGHSLGGTATISVAGKIESARAICTIASPSETPHLADYLLRQNPLIESDGEGEVTIGGRSHLITEQLLKSLRSQPMAERLRAMKLPLLVFHSPVDETLKFDHAGNLLQLAGGPASLVVLDGADHLLVNQAQDPEFVASMIATWSARYL